MVEEEKEEEKEKEEEEEERERRSDLGTTMEEEEDYDGSWWEDLGFERVVDGRDDREWGEWKFGGRFGGFGCKWYFFFKKKDIIIF